MSLSEPCAIIRTKAIGADSPRPTLHPGPLDPDMPDSRDWRSLYPFQSHEITVEGHRYHYLDEGKGPVLLMVHGNPTWSFYGAI